MRLITFKPLSSAIHLTITLVMMSSLTLAQGTTAITQTTGEGSLGTTVTTTGHTVQITGGTRPDNGTNLFHSFDQFSLGSGDTAQFLNTTPSLPTTNILGRVTGGNPSNIFGTIETASYPGANLFLMNPAGIVFGPNATLHVGGSVAFTTADYLRFSGDPGQNSGIFHADPAATSLLTSSPIVAFGFLSPNPAPIEVQQSLLSVQPGQSISLVSGNITARASIIGNGAQSLPPSVPGTQVYLASVASPGELLAGTLDMAPNTSGQSFGTLGTVELSQQATIDTRGMSGGRILIRAGQLMFNDSMLSTNTGDISLDATSIQIAQTRLTTEAAPIGNAGRISLKASGDITLNAGLVGSMSQASLGHSGNITLSSSQGNIHVNNSLVIAQTDNSHGNAGNILFTSSQGNINVTNDSAITSQANKSSGDAGSVIMTAPHGTIFLEDAHIFNRLDDGPGTLGGIRVTADNLLLSRSELLENNLTRQVAGNIDITLKGRLSLTGGSVIHTAAPGPANAADLTISARDILIADKSILFTGATSSGSGGTIRISTNSLNIQNEGRISATTSGTSSQAIGGSIIISATDQVTLASGASITASSTGQSNAGNIVVNAGQNLMVQDSSITTQAVRASGGNIDLKAIDRIQFTNSAISTSVFEGGGNGGNISIDPNVVVLQNSHILAQAAFGNGGNIVVATPLLIVDPTSTIEAASQFGRNGKVTARSNLSGIVPLLETKTSLVQPLLQSRCAALVGGQESTFILAGRNTLPLEPGDWLSSPPVSMEHWTGKSSGHTSGLMVQGHGLNRSSTVARGKNRPAELSLRRLTPPGFLVRAFAAESTGCPS